MALSSSFASSSRLPLAFSENPKAVKDRTEEDYNKLEGLKLALVDTVYGTDFGFRAGSEVRAGNGNGRDELHRGSVDNGDGAAGRESEEVKSADPKHGVLP